MPDLHSQKQGNLQKHPALPQAPEVNAFRTKKHFFRTADNSKNKKPAETFLFQRAKSFASFKSGPIQQTTVLELGQVLELGLERQLEQEQLEPLGLELELLSRCRLELRNLEQLELHKLVQPVVHKLERLEQHRLEHKLGQLELHKLEQLVGHRQVHKLELEQHRLEQLEGHKLGHKLDRKLELELHSHNDGDERELASPGVGDRSLVLVHSSLVRELGHSSLVLEHRNQRGDGTSQLLLHCQTSSPRQQIRRCRSTPSST